jgi:GNAT superfamily N-acetyltransferase
MQIDISKVHVRKVEADETGLLIEYRMAYLTELQGERSPEFQEKLKTELQRYFREAMAEKRIVAFLAEFNHEVLGFGAMVLKKIPGDFNQPTIVEGDILNMYTLPFARRKGISALILENLLGEARLLGMTKVSLHTSKDGEKL